MLAALHEIGHANDLLKDPSKKNMLQQIQNSILNSATKVTLEQTFGTDQELTKEIIKALEKEEITESGIKVFLESERNAWA